MGCGQKETSRGAHREEVWEVLMVKVINWLNVWSRGFCLRAVVKLVGEFADGGVVCRFAAEGSDDFWYSAEAFDWI